MTTRATSTPVSVKNLAVQSAATSYGPGIGTIKNEDSVPADALAPRNSSVSVEEENAKCGKWTRAGCSIPVETIGTFQSLF